MHSFLIVAKNPENAQILVDKLIKDRKIQNVDISNLSPEKVLGIEDFRRLQENAYLKPIKSPEKAIVINLSNGITLDAQNSMLKILEEPPKNTIFILLVPKLEMVLPTIISRCEVLKIAEEETVDVELGKQFDEIVGESISGKLVAAQNLSKDKNDSVNFVKNAILYTREKMKNAAEKGDPEAENLKRVEALQDAYYYLSETNVNPRMTLENLFLNLG